MHVRPSVIAGSWYPGQPDQLGALIDSYLNQVPSITFPKPVKGLISPHAGYLYSGQTAAYAYKLLENKSYDVVVILSPMHQYPPGEYVVSDYDAYQTPFGQVSIHEEFLAELESHIPITKTNAEQEHALEIQLPFLQVVLNTFQILPIMIGHGDISKCHELANVLSKILERKSFMIIASSDMHHTNSYKKTAAQDKKVKTLINAFDILQLEKTFQEFDCSVCGKVPILTSLLTLKQLNASEVKILHATNSSEITKEKSQNKYTVGYLSAAIY